MDCVQSELAEKRTVIYGFIRARPEFDRRIPPYSIGFGQTHSTIESRWIKITC